MAWDTTAEQLQLSELFKITLADGTIKYWTSNHKKITFDGNDYTPIPIRRTATTKGTDLMTGSMEITISRNDVYVDTTELLERSLDNATLLLYQVHRDDLTNYRLNFKGVSAEIAYDENTIAITFKDELNQFRTRIPKWKYTEQCRHRIYDAFCTLDIDDFKVTGTADAGSDADTMVDAARTEDDKYFDWGYLEMTSGNNDGKKRVVKAYTTGNVELLRSFPNAIAAGDTYTMYPHCHKVFSRCEDIFSNEENYGGFLTIPKQEEVSL